MLRIGSEGNCLVYLGTEGARNANWQSPDHYWRRHQVGTRENAQVISILRGCHREQADRTMQERGRAGVRASCTIEAEMWLSRSPMLGV